VQPTTYHVVYDAVAARFPGWWVAAVGVPAAALGVALLRRPARSRRVELLGLLLAIFGGTWAVVTGVGLYAQHARLRAALRSGAYTPVEGVVYDGDEGATGRPAAGSWRVDDGRTAHWYRYSGSPFTAGYRRPRAGGAVTGGARVRIADVGGRIARLEVAR
jgi:hypothetical protein